MELSIGDRAPSFILESGDGASVGLEDYRGRTVVVYFYPKDGTSGCTAEACSFRDHLGRIEAIGVAVVGISPDSPASHRRFAAKHGLTFPLLSDPDHAVAEAYGVWVPKRMYGRDYMGIERSTFIIDPAGIIQRVFRKVQVNGHVEAVLTALSEGRASS